MENVIVVLSNEETVRRIHADTPEAIHKFCVASEGETEFNRGVIQNGMTGEMLGCFVLMGTKETGLHRSEWLSPELLQFMEAFKSVVEGICGE